MQYTILVKYINHLPEYTHRLNFHLLIVSDPIRRNPMDVSFVIRQRLEEFGLEQRELARAAKVTESYISQLLTRKKAPPAPSRTDIYDKMDKFLKLPTGELARLAMVQRKEESKRGW